MNTTADIYAMQLDKRSIELRMSILKAFGSAGRGHLASAFSLVEILRTLYDHILNIDPTHPNAPDRDRCILSKGHGCLALYALLADKGFFPKQHLITFCKWNSHLGGHPDHNAPGVEASTGSLGHGLALGIGQALAGRIDKKRYKTFVIVGDGECNEGSIWEGVLCAGKHQLNELALIVDYNKQQSYGWTREIQDLEPLMDKFHSFGFAVQEVNGHDVTNLRQVFQALPINSHRPTAIICHTTKGKGIPYMENNLYWHHKSNINEDQLRALVEELEKHT